jgi:hypothetical protein
VARLSARSRHELPFCCLQSWHARRNGRHVAAQPDVLHAANQGPNAGDDIASNTNDRGDRAVLQQTAGKLRQGNGAFFASWPTQAGHPRLAVLIPAEGVVGGPEPVPGLVPGSRHDDQGGSPLPNQCLNLSVVCCS